MKTFLNVLYRRILYKIPLKLLLVLIAIFGVLFACFSNAVDFATRNGTQGLPSLLSQTNNGTYYIDKSKISFLCNYPILFTANNASASNSFCKDENLTNCKSISSYLSVTMLDSSDIIYVSSNPNITMGIYCGVSYLNNSCPTCPSQYTSLECQTEYNLIPISSVDSNYCQTNNLCPVCPSVPVGTGGYSQLYINNILHLGAPNIIMNIPDEIDWDYAYTQGGQNMNIDVVGYNVDYEKIDSIVQFQNYKPSSEDFQKIIGLLAPYTKIIVFFVFLFIVWAWIKKPFKSKKL